MTPSPDLAPALARPRVPASASILDALAEWATHTPDATAVCRYSLDGRPIASCTYQELAYTAAAAASRLERTLAPDHAALLVAPNSIESIAWFLAGLMAGVRVAAVSHLAPAFERERIAGAVQARVVISTAPLIGLEHIPLDSLTVDARSTPRRPPVAGSIILQSSGTGGSPRLARRTQASLDADAQGLAAAARITSDDRILIAVPLSHSYGVDLLCTAIFTGASLHILDAFDLRAISFILEHAAPTCFPGVPFMFEALVRSAAPPPMNSLRLALSAGSSLPLRIAQDLERACGLRVGQLYGATELGTVALSLPDAPNFDPRSVGSPVPGASIRIVAPASQHQTLAPDGEGELAINAPSMLTEYTDGPFSAVDGHLLTGDLGRIDAEGRVYITGRLKHLIDVGGLKVNPVEVEEVFNQHPGVAECALVPLPLSETVVRLRLVYVPRAGASHDPIELRAFARERLSPHKLPRVLEPVAALPRTPTGKLLRTQLNQL